MAIIHKGTPKKIRGGWAASVPPEARPGDYLAPQEEAHPAPNAVVEPPAAIPADTPPAAFTETPASEPTPSVTPAPTPEPPMATEDPLDPPQPMPEPPAPAPLNVPPAGQTRFPIGALNPRDVEMRPDLFQGRETTSGLAYDEAAVKVIVDNFDFERFDPIAVVADPENEGRYIVIAGHHRLEAVKRLQASAEGDDFDAIPVRILSGDVGDSDQRQALVRVALLSNYTVRGTNVREDARTVGALRDGGMSIADIAIQMSVNQSAVRRLLWLNQAPPTIIDRAVLQPELLPMVTQLGRAKGEYGLTDEQIDGVFRRLLTDYEATEKIPSERVIGGTLKLLAGSRGEGGTQAGMLEGMGADAILAEYQRRAQRAEDLRNAQARLRSRLTSCEALAIELGVDIDEIKRLAQTRSEALTTEQEAEVRRTLEAHAEEWSGAKVPAADNPVASGAEADPPPFVQSGADLFGASGTPSLPATDPDEPAEPDPFVQSGPGLFDAPAAEAQADPPVIVDQDPYRDPQHPAFAPNFGRWNQRFFTNPYYPAVVRTEAEARQQAKEAMASHLRAQEGLPYTPEERTRVDQLNAIEEQAKVDVLLGHQPPILTPGYNIAKERVAINRAARKRLRQEDSGTDPFQVVPQPSTDQPFVMEVDYTPAPGESAPDPRTAYTLRDSLTKARKRAERALTPENAMAYLEARAAHNAFMQDHWGSLPSQLRTFAQIDSGGGLQVIRDLYQKRHKSKEWSLLPADQRERLALIDPALVSKPIDADGEPIPSPSGPDMPQPSRGQGVMTYTDATPVMLEAVPEAQLAEDPDVRAYLSEQEAKPPPGQATFTNAADPSLEPVIPAPLVDEPLAAPRPEAADQQRAAELEQEIALCRTQRRSPGNNTPAQPPPSPRSGPTSPPRGPNWRRCPTPLGCQTPTPCPITSSGWNCRAMAPSPPWWWRANRTGCPIARRQHRNRHLNQPANGCPSILTNPKSPANSSRSSSTTIRPAWRPATRSSWIPAGHGKT